MFTANQVVPDLLERLHIEAVNSGACHGDWIAEPAGAELVSFSPATGEPLARVRMAGPADYEAVMARAAGAFLEWRTATAAFIPIPEIDVEPHSGLTLGVILTRLSNNERGELSRIVAPDIIRSQYFGWGSRMRVYDFPSAETGWSVVGGLKQRVEREFDARYATGQTRDAPYSWSIEAIYDRSGTTRFFGIGNASLKANETSYVDNQGRIDASVGRNFSHALQLAYVVCVRAVSVLPGVIPGVPSIEVNFPGQEGIGTEREFDQRLMLTYDTRDSLTVPRTGARYVLYGGFASRALGSSFADTAFGIDLRQYTSLDGDNTLAWHATLRTMPSAREVPFWVLSSLGGDRSVLDEREPLRAYGDDRFIDRNLLAAGVELRTRVLDFDAFGTHLNLEFAPFIDVGKVYADTDGSPFSHLHRGAGFGIRGIASPFVVGYVDIGYGHEKASVFSGINYPF